MGEESGLDHAEDVLLAIREYLDDEVPTYSQSLINAFGASNPVFARKRYAEFFWHCASTVPGWLGQVLLANAEAESHGSAKLFGLWEEVDYNSYVEAKVLVHAKDESRHSRLFLDLADLVFPQMVNDRVMDRLRSGLPDVRHRAHVKAGHLPEELLIDHLVQMNIGEIRTRIHMHFFAPVLYALAPEGNRDQVAKILRGLARDEVRHIAYTAGLMEEWAQSGDSERIETLYRERLLEFSRITIEQTEQTVRDFGAGRFPDLLEL